MNRLLKSSIFGFITLLGLCCATPACGQTNTIRFRNRMQTRAEVRIVAVGSTTPAEFTIDSENVVSFSFTGDLFDIQVIPRDNPDTGFRFASINLRDLAANAIDGIVTLDGAFAPSQKTLVCCRRLFRCRCYWYVSRGERIEVDLIAPLRAGGEFRSESPKMSYSDTIGT